MEFKCFMQPVNSSGIEFRCSNVTFNSMVGNRTSFISSKDESVMLSFLVSSIHRKPLRNKGPFDAMCSLNMLIS